MSTVDPGERAPQKTTLDTWFDGALAFLQPASGYRVNVDSILLAAFAAGRTTKTVIDLGAGVGAISLALFHWGVVERGVFVERDASLLDLASANAAQRGFPVTAVQVELGVDRLPTKLTASTDLVVCNPPFFAPTTLRPPRNPQAHSARVGSVGPFVAAASRILRGTRGRAVFAYPAPSLEELLGHARSHSLRPKRMRFVHANATSPARLVLVEFRKTKPGGLVVDTPLFEWVAPRRHSPELAALLLGTRPPGT